MKTHRAKPNTIVPPKFKKTHIALVAAAAILPVSAWVATVSGSPSTDPAYPPIDRPLRGNALKRHLVLTAVPANPKSLVNVRYEHLPATPALTMLGKKALPALEKGLSHNVNPWVRKRIALVLTEMADHHSLNALIAGLKDWNASVRRQSIWGLAAVGSTRAEPHLMKVVNDPEESDHVKATAIRALGWIGATSKARRFLKTLSDKTASYALRRASLRALWDMRLGIARSTLRKAIVAALESPFNDFRVFAIAAAAELRDRNPKIRKALSKLIRDPNAQVRNVAVYALGEIGDPRSIPVLRSRLPAARSGRLLNNIAFALRKMGDPTVINLLTRLLKHRQAVIRLNAAFVLGDIRDVKSLPALVSALKDGNDIVRASAISSLGKLKDPRAIAPLQALTRSKNLAIRKEALYALNNIKPGQYNDRIVKELLLHKKGSIRRQAALELARRGDKRAIAPLARCLEYNFCNSWEVAKALQKMPTDKATGPLLAAYTRRLGRYGSGSLRRAVAKRKLNSTQRVTLRSLLQVTWWRKLELRGLVRLLGKLQERAVVAASTTLLKSRDPLVVQDAAFAVANNGHVRGRNKLILDLTQSAPRIKRRVAGLIRSLNHKATRAAVRAALNGAMKGHGVHTRLAAAYALTGWDAEAGIKILVKHLSHPSRRVRAEAGRYLKRRTLRPHAHVIATAMAMERRPVVRGMLRRIVRLITPASFKPKLMHSLPL